MDIISLSILNSPSLSNLPRQIEEGILPALITQTGPAARAAIAAGLRQKLKRPLFIITTDETAARSMAGDLRYLLGEEPAVLTGRDLILRDTEVVSRQTEQQRIRLLDALQREEAPVVIATVPGLLLRTIPAWTLSEAGFVLRCGEGEGPEAVEPLLLRCGYRRSDMVEGPGQFSRRGGILDIFSPGAPQPIRLEFWGDEIDSMGFFDTDTQRRTENVEEFRILPACEALLALSEGGEAALEKLLRSQSAKLRRRGGNALAEEKLLQDADRLQNGGHLPWCDRYLPELYPEFTTALDYIPLNALVVLDAPSRCGEKAEELLSQIRDDCAILTEGGIPVREAGEYILDWKQACRQLSEFAVIEMDAFAAGRYALEPKTVLTADVRQLPSYGGSTETAVGDVRHYLELGFRVAVLCAEERRADILFGLLEREGLSPLRGWPDGGLPPKGRCTVAVGGLSGGLELPEQQLAVLSDAQMLGAGLRSRKKKKAMADRERLGSCADLSVGDLVVHEHHGIGRFAGVFKLPVDGVEKDYIKICYAGTDSLYVPATQLDLVSKYIGGGGEDRPVRLSKMGGAEWHKTKSRAKAAAKEMAGELIRLYAQRQRTPGFAFSPDTPWQKEFEDAFGYAETDDQLRCIAEIKKDMEAAMPMDRLLCGDVGYGKTEVAMRSAMKCIMDGKQCAILVPTTVLARQHYQTAARRFYGYPVELGLLSRYSTPKQKKETLAKLKNGGLDLLIGTHSLLQKTVEFKDLGLLIVDEEQRFGVTHKEKLKEMSAGVDVLTLSATPIPRTLNMALSGLRSMSTLEEPPRDRQPVQTFVMEHDWKAVTDAIRRELLRGGQVYYLHNRVENIERVAVRLREMLDGVTVAVAHGKMDEEQLSAVMDDMAEGQVQVLVCTTIIETGIDIPNVNTLIIEDADKLGLAQLHQLRGRVGRSSRRASAYLTYRPMKALTEIAEKRLTAIREFAEFNAGFQIAMRDLEIRGAGNLLGAEQSGHMMDVGYDMYLKLLEEAVLEEKGEKPPVRTECSADLSIAANIPEKYVPSAEQRMDLYRRIALIRTEADADDVTDEIIDRFGEPPSTVNALIHVALLRGEAGRAGISDITQKSGRLYFQVQDFAMERVSALYADSALKGRVKVEAGKLPRLSLAVKPGMRVLEEARAFVAAWEKTAETEKN